MPHRTRSAARATVCLALGAALLLLTPTARAGDDAPPDLTNAEGIKRALGSDEPETRLAAAKAAAGVQDKVLLPPLVRLLKDKEDVVRDAALDALAARTEEKQRKTAALSIATTLLRPLDRVPTTADRDLEEPVVQALHDLAQEATIGHLLDDVHPEAPADLIKARLRAVANVPSKKAIEALIDYGARRRSGDGHRAAVRDALRYATGQTFGGDPDQWRQWWREMEKDFDVQAAARARAEARDAQEGRERKREERREKRGQGGKRPKDGSDGSGDAGS
jgi:HEAT repeat protein